MHGGAVYAIDETGQIETVAKVPGPGGLGWLPDGRLLIAAQRDRKVLRLDPGGLVVHADLGSLVDSWVNDMWVDGAGRAYVGEMGFDVHALLRGERVDRRKANLYVVHPDGTISVAAEELFFPNGIVVSSDGATLLVAETFARQITSFAVAADGSLSDRQLWASLDFAPDGIALGSSDEDLWVADPAGNRAVRVRHGGEVLEVVTANLKCLSCALGGRDGKRLFLCTTASTDPEESLRLLSSRIDVARVGG